MKNKFFKYTPIVLISFLLVLGGCNAPKVQLKEKSDSIPESYLNPKDSFNIAEINWKNYFEDPHLIALIDSALKNNQELNIVLQEIEINKAEVLEKKGEYQPFVNVGLGLGTDKAGKYTREGAVEHNLPIADGKEFPTPLNDFKFGASLTWELDIWKKLRNAKNAAQLRYLAQSEAKNFLITQLIAEIAETYYELTALDNLLLIIEKNLVIQGDALAKMKIMKINAKANQLAVNRFEAQLLKTQNQQYVIQQSITETENKLRFLTGSYTPSILRNSGLLMSLTVNNFVSGVPAQLLENRPDIKQAEMEIEAAKLDVLSARALFYPKVEIKSGIGFQAFDPTYLIHPQSLLFNSLGDLISPLINKKAITAKFNKASSIQIQKVYHYQQTVLLAYTEVMNQLSKIDNYANSFETKSKEVNILNQSVDIANNLFQYAKADYVEVLLTQEEVLEAQKELVETKLQQLNAKINLYKALGGGWK